MGQQSRGQWTGKSIAITGAARGIGFATAREFLKAGGAVTIGDIDVDAAQESAAKLSSEFPGSIVRHAGIDVRSPEQFERFVAESCEPTGRLDVLVNNAGIMPTGPLLEESDEVTRTMFDINVIGVLNGIKAAAPVMEENGGTIVNLASIAGRFTAPGLVSYAATKSAVIELTEGARWELRESGVKVCAVLPSFTDTALISGVNIRLTRPLSPATVARGVVSAARSGRARTYRPRWIRITPATKLLPGPAFRAVNHALGTDRAFLRPDEAGRSGYEADIESLASDGSRVLEKIGVDD